MFKIQRLATQFLVAVPLMMGVCGRAKAANSYWDNDGNASNNSVVTGAGLGGTGNWDAASLKWYNGSADVAWTSGDDAIFWGNLGTVSLTAPQNVNSATFKTSGYVVTASTLTLGGPSVTIDTGAATIESTVAGTVGLTKNGNGALHLGHANTYTGGTVINGGVLGIVGGALGALPASPTIDVTINNGATLRFNVADLTLNANHQILLGTGGGVINTNGMNNGLSGVISGSSLTKTALGTLTLTNANTYTGGTTITGGTLMVNNTSGSGTGTGAVNVNSGGTLGGTGAISGAVIVNSAGHIAPYTPGFSSESLDVGSLTLAAGSILDFQLVSTVPYLKVTTTDGLTLNGGTVNISGSFPQPFGTFPLIDYSGTFTGSLSNLMLGTKPAGFTYELVNNRAGTRIELKVGIGDFNDDGTVNAADYAAWRKSGGTQTDYDVWRGHFGYPNASGNGATALLQAVPEPTSLLLVAYGFVMAAALLRRR